MSGRPRSETARRAVLDGVISLAGRGSPQAVSIEAVARESGVSKDTIYRWWTSRTEVVLEALAERSVRTIPLPDTGSLREDLADFLLATVRSADEPTRQLLRVLAAEASANPKRAAEVRDRFLSVRRSALGELLARGVARGELPAAPTEPWLDMIYGSLWYRLIFLVGDLDDQWAEDLAYLVAGQPRSVRWERRGDPEIRH